MSVEKQRGCFFSPELVKMRRGVPTVTEEKKLFVCRPPALESGDWEETEGHQASLANRTW